MENYKSIDELATEIKSDYKKLSDHEALSLAIQIQRNHIIAAGLGVSKSDSHPSALQAIAIQLGYNQNEKYNLADILKSIASK